MIKTKLEMKSASTTVATPNLKNTIEKALKEVINIINSNVHVN